VFDPDVLERLGLIALGRWAGFCLDEIALMFAPELARRRNCRFVPAKPKRYDWLYENHIGYE
jgi:hypothetical protein